MQTKCEGCVFAVKKNIDSEYQQSGCVMDRSRKLGVAEMVDGNYLLDGYCNTFRPQEWLEGLTAKQQMNAGQVAIDEVAIRMGFIVELDPTPDAISRLRITLEDIANQEGYSPAYVVVVTSKVEYNEEIWTLFLEFFGDRDGIKFHITQTKRDTFDVDGAFENAQNGWIYLTTSGEPVMKNLMAMVDKRVNIDMKKLLVVRPYEGMNGFMFPAYLFKFLNGNKPKVYGDEMVDAGSFIEKIETAAENSSPELFIDWSEFKDES
tara:strand:+ start:3359 stop:4147 length:789 start_codon:yes stop_codon:yes gene_type:complete